jgi:hypothetical protein
MLVNGGFFWYKKKKKNYGFLTIFLILYLSIRIILGRKGDSVTNIYIT